MIGKKWIFLIVIIVILLILIIISWKRPNITTEIEEPHKRVPKYRRKTNTTKSSGSKKKSTRSSKEDICREILERKYNAKFPTKRPNFLKNPSSGRNLELDGFNEDLKLAFEYNGEQHYKFPNTFHKTEEEFNNQVKRDKFKAKKCKELGIHLIEIPYTIGVDQLENFINQSVPY
jgi:hypothetical protein